MKTRLNRFWAASLLVVPTVLVSCDGSDAATEPLIEPMSLSAAAAAPQATASLGPVYRFNGRSHFADANFWSETPEGYTSGFVQVFQDAGGGNDSTALYYSVWTCTFDTWECNSEEGYGPIPGQDVRFGANSVFLSTNTSADVNPDFMRWGGEGGMVEVNWEKAAFFSTDEVRNERTTYGNIQVRHHSNSSYSSAMANGSVVGTPVERGDASMGSEHNVSIENSVANVVASASGSGHLTVGGELRTFSFHALLLSDGRAGGEWTRNNRAGDSKAHGKVSCMAIDGNVAWIGGYSTRTTTMPGEVSWRVADGGQGAAAEDMISLQPVGQPPGSADEYCWNMPDYPPLLPIEAGQIKVSQ